MNNLHKKIISLIKRHRELPAMALTTYIPTEKGDREFLIPLPNGLESNIIVATQVSTDLINALVELIRSDVIVMVPCDPFIVYWEGCPIPLIPIANATNVSKKVRNGIPYKKDHWFPVVFQKGNSFPIKS
jgi:hypothetical protein